MSLRDRFPDPNADSPLTVDQLMIQKYVFMLLLHVANLDITKMHGWLVSFSLSHTDDEESYQLVVKVEKPKCLPQEIA